MNKKIILIFLAAFLIRLIALDQSLWLDEAVTAKVVINYGFTQIISKFSPTDFHPPLYYLFMKLWTNVFGYSEVALRFPSILFSLLAGYFVYKIASLFHGFIVGVWAAAFFLFNPLIVYYSQEARMYMMATLFLTSGLYYFLKSPTFAKATVGKQKFNIKNIFLMNLFFTLAFLSFYGSAFLIATIVLYLLYKKDYKVFILNTLYFILVTLLISPLLYQQLINSKVALANVTNWSLVLGKANIKNLLLIPIKFSIGRISFYPKWLYWGIAGVWTGFVYYLLIKKLKVKSEKLNSKVKSLLFLLVFPLLLGFMVSFFAPMLQYFRFLYLVPVMALLLSYRLSSQPKYNLGGCVLAGGFLVFSLVYLLNPAFHREDWKGLVKSLPKDEPVYMITASSDPVKYYSNDFKVKELTILGQKNSCGQSTLEKNIIVIPFSAGVYGLDYKSLLSKSGYQLKKEVSFREVTYEQWLR